MQTTSAPKKTTTSDAKTSSTEGGEQLNGIRQILADTFVLYMKTYAVHWNHQGDHFFAVHKLTEEHYKDLSDAIDEMAERMRALGDQAPFSLQTILESTDLNEMKSAKVHSLKGVSDLAQSHRDLAAKCSEAIEVLEEMKDVYTVDMLTKRIGFHQKANWMLTSMIKTSDKPLDMQLEH